MRKSDLGELSLMMPVTPMRELANNIATAKWVGVTGYLFTLEVPKIDVYDYTMKNSLGWNFLHTYKTRPRMYSGGYSGQYPSPEIESFMFAFIPPEYIRGIEEWINSEGSPKAHKGIAIFK